ncbi:hypothetical protein Poli38472_002709 [Pythium oligandrum]|uniref:Uncharacterized protein n=1 Tax=Pythium oligandrum TaxID=41045 RepID=A0A8K1CIW4_PYTOL|nr:hypothetical protein Poli38472_002709 [Pythium oligandrum]|eukprot:TMW63768.1 hypothetical protein Poli38472_002709 [Pythium oligandrum]
MGVNDKHKVTSDVARLLRPSASDGNGSTSNTKGDTKPLEAFALAKEMNRLADEHGNVRKQAALALERHFLSENSPSGCATEENVFRDLAKPLFKRFNDPVEKVRDVCIRLTTKFLATEEDLLSMLPYVMPAISNRINSQWGYDEENQVFTRDDFLHDAFKRGRVFVDEAQVTRIKPDEPSEEIRLLFLELLHALLQNAFTRNASSILHAYVFDILMILVSGLHDSFHDINIQSCRLLELMCTHMVSVMKHFTVAFVRASKHLLNHRLARVRIAAIECIQTLVSCPNIDKYKGSGSDAIVDLLGYRDENVIPIAAFYTGEVRFNHFAKLDQDANPQVRRAFYAMIQDWMTNLLDRYDHEARLMPYLLSAVSDKLEDTQTMAMETLERLGKRHEDEQGEEVLEMKQYGVDGRNPSYNYTKRLPMPFGDHRPSLGTRLFVRSRTRRFLNPLLRELENWQSPTRAHAVRLLKTVIVYSEETITVDAHLLIPTLMRVWQQDLPNRSHLQEITDLVGRFIAPKTYLPLVLARIRGEQDVAGQVLSPAVITTGLEVLSYLMDGSLDKALLPHVQVIVEALDSPSVTEFETPMLRMALARVALQITQLLARRGCDAVSAYFLEHGRLTSLDGIYQRLFELTLMLQHPKGAATTVEMATQAREALKQTKGHKTLADLSNAHVDGCLESATSRLQDLVGTQWTPARGEQLLIEQLLLMTPLSVLLASQEREKRVHSVFRLMVSDEEHLDNADPEKPTASTRRDAFLSLLKSFVTNLREDNRDAVALSFSSLLPDVANEDAAAA